MSCKTVLWGQNKQLTAIVVTVREILSIPSVASLRADLKNSVSLHALWKDDQVQGVKVELFPHFEGVH